MEKIDQFGEPITLNCDSNDAKLKTKSGGYMTVVGCIIIVLWLVQNIYVMFSHEKATFQVNDAIIPNYKNKYVGDELKDSFDVSLEM